MTDRDIWLCYLPISDQKVDTIWSECELPEPYICCLMYRSEYATGPHPFACAEVTGDVTTINIVAQCLPGLEMMLGLVGCSESYSALYDISQVLK